jgi:hypothetical protein
MVMKKLIFIFAIALTLLCNISVKSQSEELLERTQKEMSKTVDWLYDSFKDFDRECFLTGTLDDSDGHYQTFTANKSRDDINDKVKWLFRKDLKFVPDTMRCQRITAYTWRDDMLALFVTALFKNDYPDLRALRVCSISPFMRHYGSEIKTVDGNRDPVCSNATDFDIELLSPSLAKTVAGYYHFNYDNVSAVSSGGDIGYAGVINRDKIAADAQKMSFLVGVFIRYGYSKNPDNSISRYSVHIPNSLSTAKECVDILKEFACTDVKETSTGYIVFDASNKIIDLISLTQDLFNKISGITVAY